MTIEQKRDLSSLTTFKIGGEAEFFASPETVDELYDVLSWARERALRVIILGGGSNILFGDGLIRGLVISTRDLKGIDLVGNYVRVGAGVFMDEINEWAILNGRSGLEWSGGLPGTIGGATYMNARAYQHEMSECVGRVHVVTLGGDDFWLEGKDLEYRYKHSVFMEHDDWIIVEVDLVLGHAEREEVEKLTRFHQEDRQKKGQYLYPSAGCAFKNDYSRNLPAGKVIDEVGLKGTRIGGAEVYERHANFIVNKGDAKADDVIRLIELIEQRVYEETGVWLEREIRIIR